MKRDRKRESVLISAHLTPSHPELSSPALHLPDRTSQLPAAAKGSPAASYTRPPRSVLKTAEAPRGLRARRVATSPRVPDATNQPASVAGASKVKFHGTSHIPGIRGTFLLAKALPVTDNASQRETLGPAFRWL